MPTLRNYLVLPPEIDGPPQGSFSEGGRVFGSPGEARTADAIRKAVDDANIAGIEIVRDLPVLNQAIIRAPFRSAQALGRKLGKKYIVAPD